MKPSERIKYIQEISEKLGNEEWSLIDLTLKQFKLPITDNWNSDNRPAYVMDMISDSSDEAIIELAKHLGLATEIESATKPTYWKEEQPRVFISHLASIKTKAKNLKSALADYSIISFVAHEDIEPTKEWQTEIEIGLSTMDALIALLTPGFKESNWTDQEVGVAIGRGVQPFQGSTSFRSLCKDSSSRDMGCIFTAFTLWPRLFRASGMFTKS